MIVHGGRSLAVSAQITFLSVKVSFVTWPGIANAVAFGPRVVWIQHVLMRPRDPAAPANLWSNGHCFPDLCFPQNFTVKLGTDDRYAGQLVAHGHFTFGMQ